MSLQSGHLIPADAGTHTGTAGFPRFEMEGGS
jgi:hypothetical protein